MKHLICASLVVALAVAARAQDATAIPGGVFVAGTTAVDIGGTPWAYVFISSPELGSTKGRHFAVHLKPAAPEAPGDFSMQGVASAHGETAVVAGFIERAVKLGEGRSELEVTVRALYRSVKFPYYLESIHSPREPGDPPHPEDPPQPDEPGTAEQLASLVRRAATDDRVAATLAQLSAGSPAIAMASGHAWGGPLPGIAAGQMVTLEIRLFDPVACTDIGVVGRVSFPAGQAQPLPAPGAPVEVPDLKSTGHLNIKLRWALPDELRRLSLLSLGFNLWRMPESFAVANGYDAAPPTTAALLQLAGGPSPEVKRVNTGTLLATKVFSAADVADFVADPDTALAVDDNGRALGTPFADGQQLRYFVTARDLLGRDGLVSPGRLAVACHRLPPPVPAGLRVRCEHRFDIATQTASDPMVLEWDANAPDDPAFLTSRYEVIRGLASGDPQIGGDVNDGADLERFDAALLIPLASVPHGAAPPAFTDPAPCVSAAGNTCWYAVRAVFDGACGPIYSDPGPPVFACVRKAGAPAPPEFCSTDTNVPLAAIAFDDAATEPAPAGAPDFGFRIRVSCKRLDPNVSWAEFRLLRGTDALGEPVREHFPAEFAGADDRVDTEFVVNASSLPPDATVECKIGTNANAVSAPATATVVFVAPPSQRLVNFLGCACSTADLPTSGALRDQLVDSTPLAVTAEGADANGYEVFRLPVDAGTPVVLQRQVGAGWVDRGSAFVANLDPLAADGRVAVPAGPEPFRALRITAAIPPADRCSHQRTRSDGSVVPLPLRVCLTPDTAEYRLYRRIDDGPLTLIAQGEGDYDGPAVKEIGHEDDTLPAASGRAVYFVQMIDPSGNASPLAQVGQCVNVIAAPPVPVLLEPQPLLDGGTTKVALSWFCPPVGVERFAVYIEPQQAGAPAPGGGGLTVSPVALTSISKHKVFDPQLQSRVTLFASRQFFTGRVGSPAFQPGPDFSLAANIARNVTYKIWVKAIGSTGGEGAPSQQFDFTWRTPPAPPVPGVEAKVPWPARALVGATEFHPLVKAQELLSLDFPWEGGDRYPVGVLIGSMPTRGHFSHVAPENSAEPFTYLELNGQSPAQSRVDPHLYLMRGGAETKSPLPAVLYRRQVANAEFPEVTGDTVQVSPLVKSIGWELESSPDGAAALIHDRFIGVRFRPIPRLQNDALDLFLLDTQPVIEGACYHYYLARFRDDGEVDSVVDAGQVTISEDF